MSTPLQIETDYLTRDGAQIHIRPLLESDLPALEWDGEYTHFRNLYLQHFAGSVQGHTLMWGAESPEKDLIGQVFILLKSRQDEIANGSTRAYLFSFRIKPEWRSQGIGGHMLRFVENYLVLRGFIWIRLNVAQDNPAARRMYEAHGYRVIGTDPGEWSYADDQGFTRHVVEPAYKMIKRLR